MDEEFFFPQNVRTSYRLWIFGPRQLKRLAGAPAVALVVGWVIYPASVVMAAAVAALVASAHVGIFCLPVSAGEETAWDIWREIQRHSNTQTRFSSMPEGGIADHIAALEEMGA